MSESTARTDSSRRGGELFIVDNSVSGWTGARYLHDWTDVAKSFDIATGYFEIGSLLELDGKWQQLEKIRILMGAEVTHSTKAAFLKATKDRAEAVLDESIEVEKTQTPFLHGVPAIVEALKSGQIECRVYVKEKFHAKAYITHAKLDVIGAQALVGSSNFTRPGLTQNVELNIQVQSGREVDQLQKWFEEHWKQAQDVTPDILEVAERHVREYSPFQVYAKALQEFFRGHEVTAGEWDQTRSAMFHELDRYQQEAYWTLMKIARQHGGAFLCDGVGLGKTFVGLMLIERLIVHENRRVVLFAPKATKEAVWEPLIRHWLPHIGGVDGGGDFSNLAVFSHTDLGRKGSFPARFARITELADAVIVDEAHHFRNPGRAGKLGEDKESRYRKLFDLLDPEIRTKSLFLFTATPINNRLTDFRHMVELFSRRDEAYFARTLGINNLRAHFGNLEKALQREFHGEAVTEAGVVAEAQEILATSDTFKELVVQRSRAYAVASQLRETGTAAMFPKRTSPQVAAYSIKKSYGKLLDDVEAAFSKDKPLFSLAMYYPLAYYKGSDATPELAIENNRQFQVVGLIRTNFLKRFESSVWAFEQSCDRLLEKLLAFVEKNSETDAERRRLERWKLQNADILGYAAQLTLNLDGSPDDDADEDVVPQELLDKIEPLPRNEYKVDEILDETFLDLDQIIRFLAETRKFKPKQDDKLQKLIRLLKSKELAARKVLIFSEFSDTARYIAKHLGEAGVDGLEQLDSGSKKNRADVITRFSPYYNGSSSPELEAAGKDEIRVLVSTDVLSEGLNLQDATRMINYDIHWNPVRLMQRVGRVDRRMSPAVEERLKADHPTLAGDRGTVAFWNFLPPDELNQILSLYTRVTQKVMLISRAFGIEGKKLLTPEDDFEALKEFNQAYEGTTSAVEEMHLEYQSMLDETPGLGDVLDRLPGAVFSGRQREAKGHRGVFFCFALPALDKELNVFTEEAGTTRWYLYDAERDTIRDEPSEIVGSIRSTPQTLRATVTPQPEILAIREKVLKHIKDTYLKRVDAPVGVKPVLKCWMELNDGT